MAGKISSSGGPAVWEEIFASRSWGKYPSEHVVRFVARNFYGVPDRARMRLQEVGCGPGANIWFMAREGFSVSGIDGSKTAIKLAGERLAAEGLSGELVLGNFVNLPWADGVFDGVIENVALYCNPPASVRAALREIRRVLKPGAPFQSSFFTDRTWGYGMGRMVEPNCYADIPEGPFAESGYCMFLNRESVGELFGDFSDVAVERISWTMEHEQHLVEQFVITCRKTR
jgi:SAM-dependent methyltransferase